MAEVPAVRAGGGSGSPGRAPTALPGAMALAAVAHLLSPPDGALRPGRSLPYRTHPQGLGKEACAALQRASDWSRPKQLEINGSWSAIPNTL